MIVGGICGCELPALITCDRTGGPGRGALRFVSGCAIDSLSVGVFVSGDWRKGLDAVPYFLDKQLAGLRVFGNCS